MKLPDASNSSIIRIHFHPYQLFGFTTNGGINDCIFSILTSECFFIIWSVSGTATLCFERNFFVVSFESASFLASAKSPISS